MTHEGGWRPAATAPTGVRVDVWVRRVGSDASGHRNPDCVLKGGKIYPYWTNSNGKWFTGRRFYQDDDEYYDPSLTDDGSMIVTHWRPLPAPPETD